MTGNCIVVYTNQSLVETSRLNKVYYFFPWGSLEFRRIEIKYNSQNKKRIDKQKNNRE